MSDTKDTDRLVQEYVDGRLTGDSKAAFEARLAQETDLARRVEEYRALGRALREGGAELPAGFHARARARFEDSFARERQGARARATPESGTARARAEREDENAGRAGSATGWGGLMHKAVSWPGLGLAAATLLLAVVFLPHIVRERMETAPLQQAKTAPSETDEATRTEAGAAAGAGVGAKAETEEAPPGVSGNEARSVGSEALSDDERRNLEALGYVTGGRPSESADALSKVAQEGRDDASGPRRPQEAEAKQQAAPVTGTSDQRYREAGAVPPATPETGQIAKGDLTGAAARVSEAKEEGTKKSVPENVQEKETPAGREYDENLRLKSGVAVDAAAQAAQSSAKASSARPSPGNAPAGEQAAPVTAIRAAALPAGSLPENSVRVVRIGSVSPGAVGGYLSMDEGLVAPTDVPASLAASLAGLGIDYSREQVVLVGPRAVPLECARATLELLDGRPVITLAAASQTADTSQAGAASAPAAASGIGASRSNTGCAFVISLSSGPVEIREAVAGSGR